MTPVLSPNRSMAVCRKRTGVRGTNMGGLQELYSSRGTERRGARILLRRLGERGTSSDPLADARGSVTALRRDTVADAELLPGTLDVLILKAVSLGRLHGYGVLLRIGQISGGALSIEQGALYPALYRLERQGLLEAEWGVSENNRRARYYKLSAAGRKRLRQETNSWKRLAAAMDAALRARPDEVQ